MASFALVGGHVLDGSGSPAVRADVLLRGGEVREVGALVGPPRDAVVLDVEGCIVSPGFIDVHSHADNAPMLPSDDCSKVLQGVTTEVVGNCGMSLAPRSRKFGAALESYLARIFPACQWEGESFADWLSLADGAGYVTNYAPLVGHGTIRLAVMGLVDRPSTEREVGEMVGLLSEALDAGAVGMSSGLIYAPGCFAGPSEIERLGAVLRDRNKTYATHVRGEGATRLQAIQEAIDFGVRTGGRVEISHHKAMGREQWGGVATSLELAREAREKGVDVRFDVYPYTASSTMLTVCLPPDMAGLDSDSLLERLASPGVVAEVRSALEDGSWSNHIEMCGGFSGVMISSTGDGEYEGKTLHQVAEDLDVDGAAALVQILRQESLRASMVCFAMCEEDVEEALRDDWTSIGSDGLPPGKGGKPHPRQWGTFPRVFSEYVRARRVLTLEEAVRRMTSLPANSFGLTRRGLLRTGCHADVTVFDPDIVQDRATYQSPVQAPSGIRHVFIEGEHVVREGAYLGRRVGSRVGSA